MYEEIMTDRLLLRTSREEFAPSIAGYYKKNREFFEIFESSREDRYYTKEYQRLVMRSEMTNMNEGRSMYFYVSLREKPERIIGSISFANIRKAPYYSTIFGYDVHHELWGKGIATESCREAIGFMLKSFSLHRIEARVATDNPASIRVLEHLDFIKEGLEQKSILLGGEFRDHFRYAYINEGFTL